MAEQPNTTPEAMVEFTFAHASGWEIYIFIALALGAGMWGWYRYGPSAPGAWGTLARCCRIIGLVLIIFKLTGPSWQKTTTLSRGGKLLVAIDDSLSMTRTDGPNGQARLAVLEHVEEAFQGDLAQDLTVSWRTLSNGASELDKEALQSLQANGGTSPLGEQLQNIILSEQPDLVLLVSDGRTTNGPMLSELGPSLRQRGIPQSGVWAIGVGGNSIDSELHIESIEGNRQAALDERHPLLVRLSGRALTSQTARLRLYHGDRILQDKDIRLPQSDDLTERQDSQHLLEVRLQEEGEHSLRVEVSQGDLVDTSEVLIQVSERKLSVLMLAHRPRFDMRYVRNALHRDPTIDLHCYLADGRWRRWGADSGWGPDVLPLHKNTMRDYDAIILGDVSIDDFRPDQMANINHAVRKNGAGLIWIPGERGTIASFRDSALGDLLPVQLGTSAEVVRGYLNNQTLSLQRSPTAIQYNILATDRKQDWDSLPSLRGLCPVKSVRKGALVLMETKDERPVVVSRNFELGRSVFIGVDDTWRWRRNNEDHFLHRFHSQLLRWASAQRKSGDHEWRLQALPYRAVPGQILRLECLPNSNQEDQRLPNNISIRLQGPNQQQHTHLLERVTNVRAFQASFPAPGIGTWRAVLVDGKGVVRKVASEEIHVTAPADEVRDPRADMDALRELTRSTGGQLFQIDQEGDIAFVPVEGAIEKLDTSTGFGPALRQGLLSKLPNLEHQQQQQQLTPVWSGDRAWWVFLLIIGLFFIEWAIRRSHRLP